MSPPFIGRARERELLRAAWADVCSGRARLICLVGEPGIGKTRLAEDLAEVARASGPQPRWGRAWDGPGTPAWWPWTQAFGARVGPPVDHDGFDALDAWARVVRSTVAAPQLVILDDLHAADVPTARLLAFVARFVRDVPLLVVATWRPADASARPVLAEALHAASREGVVVEVGPLGEAEVGDYLRLTRGPEAVALAGRAWRSSGGNPLFLGEVAPRLGGRDPLPDTLRRAVAERLALADAELVDLLEQAAVAGVEPGLLGACSGLGRARVDALLDRGRRLGVLGDRGFRHEVVRETLVAGLHPERRAALHQRAAEAWIARPDAQDRALEIARHQLAADRVEVATPWLLRAVSAAFGRGAPEEVVELLAGAAESGQPALLAALAEARLRSGDLGTGTADCARALATARAAGDVVAFAHAALAWGLTVQLGTVDAGHVGTLEEALDRVGPDHPALRVRLLARLAAALQPTLDPTRALDLARAAVAGARGLSDPDLLLAVLRTARSAYRPLDPLEERLALDAEAVALAGRLGERDAAFEAGCSLSLARLERGDAPAARAWFRDAERLARGRSRHELSALQLRALDAALWGAPEEALEASDQALHLQDRLPARPSALGIATLQRLLLVRWLGPEAGARVLEVAPRLPPVMAGFVGALWLQLGREAEAEAVWRVSRAAPPLGIFQVVPNAELAARFGTDEEVRTWRDHLRPLSGRLVVYGAVPACDGPVDRLLARLDARLGDHASALANFASARELAERVGSAPMLLMLGHGAVGSHGGGAAAGPERLRGAATYAPGVAVGAFAPGGEGVAVGAVAPGGVGVAGAAAVATADARRVAPALRREGSLWRVGGGAGSFLLPDSDGLRYLARLLAAPGEEIHVLELAREGRRSAGVRLDEASPGPALDPVARDAYRRRLRAMAAEREHADPARLAELDREVAFLEVELGRAVGLGGRDRAGGASAERARVNLTQRIKQAIDRVAEHDPALGHHLRTCVRTGSHCRYDPPP